MSESDVRPFPWKRDSLMAGLSMACASARRTRASRTACGFAYSIRCCTWISRGSWGRYWTVPASRAAHCCSRVSPCSTRIGCDDLLHLRVRLRANRAVFRARVDVPREYEVIRGKGRAVVPGEIRLEAIRRLHAAIGKDPPAIGV